MSAVLQSTALIDIVRSANTGNLEAAKYLLSPDSVTPRRVDEVEEIVKAPTEPLANKTAAIRLVLAAARAGNPVLASVAASVLGMFSVATERALLDLASECIVALLLNNFITDEEVFNACGNAIQRAPAAGMMLAVALVESPQIPDMLVTRICSIALPATISLLQTAAAVPFGANRSTLGGTDPRNFADAAAAALALLNLTLNDMPLDAIVRAFNFSLPEALLAAVDASLRWPETLLAPLASATPHIFTRGLTRPVIEPMITLIEGVAVRAPQIAQAALTVMFPDQATLLVAFLAQTATEAISVVRYVRNSLPLSNQLNAIDARVAPALNTLISAVAEVSGEPERAAAGAGLWRMCAIIAQREDRTLHATASAEIIRNTARGAGAALASATVAALRDRQLGTSHRATSTLMISVGTCTRMLPESGMEALQSLCAAAYNEGHAAAAHLAVAQTVARGLVNGALYTDVEAKADSAARAMAQNATANSTPANAEVIAQQVAAAAAEARTRAESMLWRLSSIFQSAIVATERAYAAGAADVAAGWARLAAVGVPLDLHPDSDTRTLVGLLSFIDRALAAELAAGAAPGSGGFNALFEICETLECRVRGLRSSLSSYQLRSTEVRERARLLFPAATNYYTDAWQSVSRSVLLQPQWRPLAALTAALAAFSLETAIASNAVVSKTPLSAIPAAVGLVSALASSAEGAPDCAAGACRQMIRFERAASYLRTHISRDALVNAISATAADAGSLASSGQFVLPEVAALPAPLPQAAWPPAHSLLSRAIINLADLVGGLAALVGHEVVPAASLASWPAGALAFLLDQARPADVAALAGLTGTSAAVGLLVSRLDFYRACEACVDALEEPAAVRTGISVVDTAFDAVRAAIYVLALPEFTPPALELALEAAGRVREALGRGGHEICSSLRTSAFRRIGWLFPYLDNAGSNRILRRPKRILVYQPPGGDISRAAAAVLRLMKGDEAEPEIGNLFGPNDKN